MNINEKKILMVDDNESFLKMLGVLLDKEGFTNVRCVSCGTDAIKVTQEWEPDIIVLDVMMPDMSGFDVCENIRKYSMVPILFLSAKEEEKDRLQSFSSGGDDFISKSLSNEELIARIRATLSRCAYYENMGKEHKKEVNIVSFGRFHIDLNKKELYKDNKVVELTIKEYILLEYLIENRNVTLSKRQIVLNVWEDDYEGYDNTISVHIRHLREKIEDSSSKPVYIKTVKGIGYRFDLDE